MRTSGGRCDMGECEEGGAVGSGWWIRDAHCAGETTAERERENMADFAGSSSSLSERDVVDCAGDVCRYTTRDGRMTDKTEPTARPARKPIPATTP